jgi:hypothetical protein
MPSLSQEQLERVMAILKSVGDPRRGAVNQPLDVLAVQSLLNNWILFGALNGRSPVLNSGKCDAAMIKAIGAFQSIVMGMRYPDRRIDPGRPTWKVLSGPVKVVPLAVTSDGRLPASEVFDSTCPEKHLTCITPKWADIATEGLKNTFYQGGREYVGPIKRGMVFPTVAGERVVIGATSKDVYFLLNGKFYSQSGVDFSEDAYGEAFGLAGHRARGMVILGKIQMAFIMGLASAVSGVGFVAVMGTNIVRFFVETDAVALVKRIAAIYAAYKALDAAAPTLTDKIFEWSTAGRILLEALKRVPGAMLEMSPEDIAKLLGGLVGKVGKQVVIEAVKSIKVAGSAILVFLITELPTKAGKVLVEDHARAAKQLAIKLRSLGIAVTDEEARQIVEEIQRNPEKIKALLQGIKSDL